MDNASVYRREIRVGCLPNVVRLMSIFLLAVALTAPVDARADTHYPPSVRGFIDGIWDIEDEGSVKIESMILAVNRQFGSLGKRSEDAPLIAAGFVRHKGDVGFRKWRSGRLARTDDGAIIMSFGQFGYCNCGSIDYTVRSTGDPDVMIGEWVYKDNERGSSIWRRRPPVTIEAVSYLLRHSNKTQRFVRDAVAYKERPLNVADWPKAYEHSIWLSISGRGFAGGHEVWFKPDSQLKLGGRRWRCHDGSHQEGGTNWNRCSGRNRPDLGVVGLVLEVRISTNITSGIKTLWVDGQPVYLYVHGITGSDPVTSQTDLIKIEIIDATTPDAIDQITIGQSFRARLTYAEKPDTEITETVAITSSDGTVREVSATGNTQVILSDPVLVVPSAALQAGVAQ